MIWHPSHHTVPATNGPPVSFQYRSVSIPPFGWHFPHWQTTAFYYMFAWNDLIYNTYWAIIFKRSLVWSFLYFSDIVSGLPPSSHTSKTQSKVQKSIYIGTDPNFNSKNFTKLISLLANKLKENGNISDLNMSLASTSWKSIFLKRLNSSEQVYKMIRASTPLPQTTVFPVTRKNIGQILKTLIMSKKAKAQGLAFVKNKNDLRDALKILLASRAMSLKRLMPRGNILSVTKAKQNDNDSSTPTSVLEILTTTIPNSANLTDTHLQAKSNIEVTIPTKSDPLKDIKPHLNSKFILHSLNTKRQNKKTKKLPEQPPISIQKMMSQSKYLTNGKLNSGSKPLQSFKRRKLPSEPIELYNANNLPSKKYTNVLKPNKTPDLLNLKEEMVLDDNKNAVISTKPDVQTLSETAINISPNKPTNYTVFTETQPKIVGTSIEQEISKPKPTQTVVPNLSSGLAALIKLKLNRLTSNSKPNQSSGPTSSKTVGKRLGGYGDIFRKPAVMQEMSKFQKSKQGQLEIPKIKASPDTNTYVRPTVSSIKEKINAKPFEKMQKSDFQLSVSSKYSPNLTMPKMFQTTESKLSSGLAELIKRRLSILASKSTPNKIVDQSIKSAASKTNIRQSKESATRKTSPHSIEALKQLTAVKESSNDQPSEQKQQLEIPTINALPDTKAYVKTAYVEGQLNAEPFEKLKETDLKLSVSSKNRPIISLSKATKTIKSEPSLEKLRSYKLTSMFKPKGGTSPFSQLMQFSLSKTVQTPFQGLSTLKQPPVMPEMYTHHQSKQTQLQIPTINTLPDTKADKRLKVSFRKGSSNIKPYERVPKADLQLNIFEKNRPDIPVPMANQNAEPNISSDDLAALIKLRLAKMASKSKHSKSVSSDSQPKKSASSNAIQNKYRSSIDTLTQSDIMQAEYSLHSTKSHKQTVPTPDVYKKTDVQPKTAYVKSKFSVKPLERMQESGSKLSVSAKNIPMSNKYSQAKQKHTSQAKESPNRQTGYGIADVRNQNKERIRLQETVAVKNPRGVYNQKAISVVSDTGRVSFSNLKNTKPASIKPNRKKHTEGRISTTASIKDNKKQTDMKTVPSSNIMLRTSHKTQMSYKHKSGPNESPLQKELNNNKRFNKQWYVKNPLGYGRKPANEQQPTSTISNGSNKSILNSKLKTTSIIKQHKKRIEFPPEYNTQTEGITSSNGYSSDNGHHQTIQSEAMFPYNLPQSTPRPFDAKLDVGHDRRSTNNTEMPSAAQQNGQITVLDKSTALGKFDYCIAG